MTYTASTRTISGLTPGTIAQDFIGTPAIFTIGSTDYFGTVDTVASDGLSFTLNAEGYLPSSDGTVTNLSLSDIAIPPLNPLIDIVSLIDLKTYMGIAQTDTTKDVQFSSWITTISQLIENELGNQPVRPRPMEDFLDGEGDTKLYLNKGRIVSLLPDPNTGSQLDSLQWRAAALGDWEQMVENINLVYLNPISNWCIELLDYRIFPIGWKNIRVYYSAGFDPIPGDITKMCFEMIQTMWDESKSGGHPRLGMRSANRGGAGTNLGDSFLDMDARWKAVIDRYRRII